LLIGDEARRVEMIDVTIEQKLIGDDSLSCLMMGRLLPADYEGRKS
jgi:hypothetical protein